MEGLTPIETLLNRVKRFLDVCDHAPGSCGNHICDQCDGWQEAKENVETAMETVEREMGE